MLKNVQQGRSWNANLDLPAILNVHIPAGPAIRNVDSDDDMPRPRKRSKVEPIEGPIRSSALRNIEEYPPLPPPLSDPPPPPRPGPKLRNTSDDEAEPGAAGQDGAAVVEPRNVIIDIEGFEVTYRGEYRSINRHEQPRYICRPCPIHGLPCNKSRSVRLDEPIWGAVGTRLYWIVVVGRVRA